MTSGADLFFGLFNNLAIFIILVAVYGFLNSSLENKSPIIRQIILGFTFALLIFNLDVFIITKIVP